MGANAAGMRKPQPPLFSGSANHRVEAAKRKIVEFLPCGKRKFGREWRRYFVVLFGFQPSKWFHVEKGVKIL